jgi:hypothetical protein
MKTARRVDGVLVLDISLAEGRKHLPIVRERPRSEGLVVASTRAIALMDSFVRCSTAGSANSQSGSQFAALFDIQDRWTDTRCAIKPCIRLC